MKNKIHILHLVILLNGLSSCSYQAYSPIVKKRYEYNHVYRRNKDFEIRKHRKGKARTAYIKYDRSGNEIEIGEYGELWYFREVTINPDSSISVVSGHGIHIKKLNTVMFKTYNQDNQVLTNEFWRYKDNRKDYLIYRVEFRYVDGELIGETEYDSEGNISREMEFNEDKTVQLNSNKVPFYQPIVRIEGESRYEIKYDSMGREIEKFHYSNEKFLRRTVTVYERNLKTTYVYDDSPDKLSSFKEEKYDYLTGRIIRKYWKVLDSTVEEVEIFEYNKNGLLKRVSTYKVDLRTGKDVLESFTTYRYKYY